jgi:predicted RNase H-like HicB family nuclease
MTVRFYRALIGKDRDTDYGVVFPDFPGCVTTGETPQEAATNAIEALSLHLEGMLEDSEPIPAPSPLNAPLPDWLDGKNDSGEPDTQVLIPIEMPGKIVRANITLDEGLLARLDAAAAAAGISRSGYIAEAVRDRLRAIHRPEVG